MSAQNKFTTCQFILEKCDFNNPQLAPTCVQNWCGGEPYGFGPCTTDFTGVPAECCSQSDVASCMASFQASQGYGVFSDACLTLQDYVAQCEAQVSGFASDSFAQQAACLCYDGSGNYVPNAWDDAAATCLSTGQQAHPTIWSLLNKDTALVGLCTEYPGSSGGASGGGGGGGATVTPTATAGFSVSTQDSTPALTLSTSPTSGSGGSSGGGGSSGVTGNTATATGGAATTSASSLPSNTPSTTSSKSGAEPGFKHGSPSYTGIKLVVFGLSLVLPVFLMS